MTDLDFNQWRISHNLSQAAAAKVLGLSWSTVQRYDTGKFPIPGPVVSICRAIDRHPDLLDGLMI